MTGSAVVAKDEAYAQLAQEPKYDAPCDAALGGSPAIGDAVDFHLAVHHHARHHAGPGRRIGAEIFGEDLVEALKVPGIIEPDAATHDILGLVTGLSQDREQVAD